MLALIYFGGSKCSRFYGRNDYAPGLFCGAHPVFVRAFMYSIIFPSTMPRV
jgi:hypothetical protein